MAKEGGGEFLWGWDIGLFFHWEKDEAVEGCQKFQGRLR